jgi:hypothetical protein
MKKIILVLLLLACMMGTANAAYWKVEAKVNENYYNASALTNFSVILNDLDLDNKVTAADIVWFSGVNITTSGVTRFYDEIRGLSAMIVDGLELVSADYSHWGFVGMSYTERGWTYSASETSAPTPIPGAVWLLGTGIMGLFGLRRKFL